MKKTTKIILAALLLASTIALARILSIRTPIITIGFTFVPHVFTAILLGPKYSIAISALADLIGALLFPIGPYFFGYTLSATLAGTIYGFTLYQPGKFQVNRKFIWKLVLCFLLNAVFVNGLLNTLWVWITTQGATTIIMSTRIIKQIAMLPIQIITSLFLTKILTTQINTLKNDQTQSR